MGYGWVRASARERLAKKSGMAVWTALFARMNSAWIAFRNQRKRFILIDGEVLADLMIRFNLGVRLQRTFEMKRIDQDYFDEADAD